MEFKRLPVFFLLAVILVGKGYGQYDFDLEDYHGYRGSGSMATSTTTRRTPQYYTQRTPDSRRESVDRRTYDPYRRTDDPYRRTDSSNRRTSDYNRRTEDSNRRTTDYNRRTATNRRTDESNRRTPDYYRRTQATRRQYATTTRAPYQRTTRAPYYYYTSTPGYYTLRPTRTYERNTERSNRRYQRTTARPTRRYYTERPTRRYNTERPTRRYYTQRTTRTTERPTRRYYTQRPTRQRYYTEASTLPTAYRNLRLTGSQQAGCECTAEIERSVVSLDERVETLRQENAALRSNLEKLERNMAELFEEVGQVQSETLRWKASLHFPGLSIIRNPSQIVLSEDVVTDRTFIDCQDAYDKGERTPGVYSLQPDGSAYNILAYCQNGWTFLQRRFDGSTDFYRNFSEYLRGFGNFSGEFWLGLENMHQLTGQQSYFVRIDMEGTAGTFYYAVYSNFSVGPEKTHYALHYEEMRAGNVDDGFRHLQNRGFSTRDNDHDSWYLGNCASYYHTAFWLDRCGTDLNRDPSRGQYGGMRWAGRIVKSSLIRIKPAWAITPKDLTAAP